MKPDTSFVLKSGHFHLLTTTMRLRDGNGDRLLQVFRWRMHFRGAPGNVRFRHGGGHYYFGRVSLEMSQRKGGHKADGAGQAVFSAESQCGPPSLSNRYLGAFGGQCAS